MSQYFVCLQSQAININTAGYGKLLLRKRREINHLIQSKRKNFYQKKPFKEHPTKMLMRVPKIVEGKEKK